MGWTTLVRFPAGAGIFFRHCVQIGSESHPATPTEWLLGALSPGKKLPGREATTHFISCRG